MYLKLRFGYFLPKAHGMIGATAPMRKKNTRKLIENKLLHLTWPGRRHRLVCLTLRELEFGSNDPPLSTKALVAHLLMQLDFWAYNDASRAEDMDMWADEAIVPTCMSPKDISN